MILHFFIIFSILAFFFTVIHAILTIVFKVKFNFFYHINKIFKIPVLVPILFLMLFFILFLVLYSLSNSDSYLNSYDKITSKGTSTGAIGDFLNGLIAPTVSMISIIYLWKAFVQQFKANQMLYSFEIERSFKNDLEWLRNNSEEVDKLEKILIVKNDEELKSYLINSENSQIRKSIYIIDVFEGIYLKLEEKKSEENNFENIKNEAMMILNSLYLPSFKIIFRTFTNYINNLSEEDKDNLDRKNIEIEFIKKFSDFYTNTPNITKDRLFEVNLKTITEFINQ